MFEYFFFISLHIFCFICLVNLPQKNHMIKISKLDRKIKHQTNFFTIEASIIFITCYNILNSDLFHMIHYITGQWQHCIVIVHLLSHKDVIMTIYILFLKHVSCIITEYTNIKDGKHVWIFLFHFPPYLLFYLPL
jgi:hypothetical protein